MTPIFPLIEKTTFLQKDNNTMNKTYIPESYRPLLNNYDTQRAIAFIKLTFQEELANSLHLKRVSAPLFVLSDSGLNDNLSGVERPVSFDIPAADKYAQVVQSLAKWKRLALKKYGFGMHEGIYTDMNAIRRDEELDNLHSIYVDQWDWERIIRAEDRTIEYLKSTVNEIILAISRTQQQVCRAFPQLEGTPIEENVFFISAEELEAQYPSLTPEQREAEITKLHRSVCITKIGAPLKNGQPHSKRAPDYDDWQLNCDILVYNEVLKGPMELSSMGIRVDPEVLRAQLKSAGNEERASLPFHKMLLNNELPLTIGGGIGQSRMCMLIMRCAHIGEVQSSIWDEDILQKCTAAGIPLL